MMPCLQNLLSPICALALVASACAHAEPAPKRSFREAPHHYFTRESKDAFTLMLKRIESGSFRPDISSEKAYLASVLKALDVPESSQLLVYSATSLQGGLIRPANPRALYFNDEVYVGYVPGGRMEVTAIDPELGPVFQLTRSSVRSGPPVFERSERCMNCHAGNTSWQLPGFSIESVIPSNTGGSLEGFRREVIGHTVPIDQRFGGWVVTGAHERGEHLGNLVGESTARGVKRLPNPPGRNFDIDNYLVKTSDYFTHLVHEHQLGFHNLVTLGVYRTREALDAGKGSIRAEDAGTLNDIARQLVRYTLFANEARLPSGGVKPDPAYVKDFAAQKKAIKNGASLRDLDLHTRLFRYRCSYLVHSPGFLGMPREFKERVLAGLSAALRETGAPPEFNYLPPTEKKAISIILHETGVLQ